MPPLEALAILAPLALVLWPLCVIVGKMGYGRGHAVWLLVPGVNVVMLYVLAFRRWPIEKAT